MSDPLPRYLGPEEAGAYLGLSPKTLQRMRVTGEGPPYVKARRRVIYDRLDLDEWTAKRKRRFTGEEIEDPEADGNPEPDEE
ncbi:MAG: helix-turn-helix domain-containing protein [Alphaproteobacteria bacterium]|nr:helix-turn-helix domain-containing protein [Alphaproteobacteria bacterium]